MIYQNEYDAAKNILSGNILHVLCYNNKMFILLKRLKSIL